MNITKQRLQETVNTLVFEYEELSVRQLERLSLLNRPFDFTYENRLLDQSYYRYWGGVVAIRSLFDYLSNEYDYLTAVTEQLLSMSDSFGKKLLEISSAKRQAALDEPVFAPTTAATERVLIAAEITGQPVTPKQDGETNPACTVEEKLIGVPVVACRVCCGTGEQAVSPEYYLLDDHEPCSHCHGTGFEPDLWEEAA